MQNAPGAGFASFKSVTPSDTTLLNCRMLLVNCTVAGNIVVNPDKTGTGNNCTLTLPVGLHQLPIALDQGRVLATGLTATATITALA